MKKFCVGIVVVLSLGLLFGGNAGAHVLWLNAQDYTPVPDETVQFTVGWGHHFYAPVNDVLSGGNLIEEIAVIDPQGRKIAVNSVNQMLYESAEKLPAGTYLAVVRRKNVFVTRTKRGVKLQSKKGLDNVVNSRFISMNGKAILNVGEADSAGAANIMQPLNEELELVPLVDPATLRAGDYFPFQLLAKGKPLSGTVNATYVGFSTDGAWAYTTKTDREGMGKVKMLTSGIWMIQVSVTRPYPDKEEADTYFQVTSLCFEIR